MRVLLLTHAFNSLSQRLFVALREAGHQVSVEFDIHDQVSEEAVSLFAPDVIVAPFLKRAIPESIWRKHLCLVVHPGIVGDRGPSALDWAILNNEPEWGITILQAEAQMDAGDIWESRTFDMRPATKASLYRNEVTDQATDAVMKALANMQNGGFKPRPLQDHDQAKGQLRPICRQADRSINWQKDDTRTIIQRIRSADGFPGLRSELFGEEVNLFDAHPEDQLGGDPGQILGRRHGAVCRATIDGAVWIGHVKRHGDDETSLKLPTALAFGPEAQALPKIQMHSGNTYQDVWFKEVDGVGYLHFPYYNGAMSTVQCKRLQACLTLAKARPCRVVVLMGGPDFWSNGIHLNTIEAAESPAEESWKNINAMDDFVREIIETPDKIVIAAMRGNAGAGGVFMALAADKVLARDGVILNPHYKGMGNLYGSEYWTYLLPKRAGKEKAELLTQARLPMGVREAMSMKIVDESLAARGEAVDLMIEDYASRLAKDPALGSMISDKRKKREQDEATKPLAEYRAEELERMKLNFYGFDPSYHVARYNFVRKIPKSRTPLTIAQHRRQGLPTMADQAGDGSASGAGGSDIK